MNIVEMWKKVGIGGLIGAFWAYLNRASSVRGPEHVVPLQPGQEEGQIAYGRADDPEIRKLLNEYGAYLERQGVNLNLFSPEELTRLRRTGLHAIPNRTLWDEMAKTILAVAQPLRLQFDGPLVIYNAYRPRWYNNQVSTARNSLHIRNAALDLIPKNTARREEFARLAAEYFREFGDLYNIGMGIYNYPKMTGVHVDALVRDRKVGYAATNQWLRATR